MKLFNLQGFAPCPASVSVQNLRERTVYGPGVVHFSGVNPYVYMSSPGDMKSNIMQSVAMKRLVLSDNPP